MVVAISGYLLHQASSLCWQTIHGHLPQHCGVLQENMRSDGKESSSSQQLLPGFGWRSVKHRPDPEICHHRFMIFILGDTGIQRRISSHPGDEYSVASSARLHGLAELKSSYRWNTQKCCRSFTRLMFKPWRGVTKASSGHKHDSLVEEQAETCTATAFSHALHQSYQLFPHGK